MKNFKRFLIFALCLCVLVSCLALGNLSAAEPVKETTYDFTKDFNDNAGKDITTVISGSNSVGVFNTTNVAGAAAYDTYLVRPFVSADMNNTYGFGIGTNLLSITASGTQNAGAGLKNSAVLVDFQHPTGEAYPVKEFSGTATLTTAQSFKSQIVTGGTSFIIGKKTVEIPNEATDSPSDTVIATRYIYTTLGIFDEKHKRENVNDTHGSDTFTASIGGIGTITVDSEAANPARSKNSSVTQITSGDKTATEFAEYFINDEGGVLTSDQKSALANYFTSLEKDDVNIPTITNFMDFKVEDLGSGAKITVTFLNMPEYSNKLQKSATDTTLVDMPSSLRFSYTVSYTFNSETYDSHIGGIGVVFGPNGNVYSEFGMGTEIVKNLSFTYDTSSYVAKPEIDESKFVPTVLGAKILKGAKPTDVQRIRVNLDFSNIEKATEQELTIEEYGIVWRAGSVENGDFTREQLINYGNVVTREYNGGEVGIMKIAVNKAVTSYDKGISILGFVRDSNGNYYYSEKIADKSVNGVMKAYMLDKLSNKPIAFGMAIDKYVASEYFTFGSSYNIDEVKALIADYLKGDIAENTNNEKTAKEMLGFVFYFYNNSNTSVLEMNSNDLFAKGENETFEPRVDDVW